MLYIIVLHIDMHITCIPTMYSSFHSLRTIFLLQEGGRSARAGVSAFLSCTRILVGAEIPGESRAAGFLRAGCIITWGEPALPPLLI